MSTSPHDPGSAASRGTALLEPLREEGRQLDSAARADLQSSLGASFGDVVVHTGSASAAAAERADAAAFTVGRHVVFGAGAYDPGSTRGRMLLAHELAHVVQQRRGGGDPDLGESLPGSALGRHAPGLGEATAGVTAAQAALGMSAPVAGAAPVGVAKQDKGEEKNWRRALGAKAREETPAVTLLPTFEYVDEKGVAQRVSLGEGEKLRAQALRRMGVAISNVETTSEFWRKMHKEQLDMGHAESWGDLWDKPSRIFGVAANIRAGIVPPTLGIWSHPIRVVRQSRDALDKGNLAEAARLLRLATAHMNSAKSDYNVYIEASIGGAEKLQGELETVRDTSFAISVGAGAIVIAPVVASGVAAMGVTGGAATLLTAGGTGLATMGGGAILRGTADVTAQKVNTGKVDFEETKKFVRAHLKEDLVTGLSAGLAPGAGKAAGLGKQGLTTAQTILRQGAAQAGVTATTNLVGTAADTGLALGEGKTLDEAVNENLLPGLEQTAVATVSSAVTAPLGGMGRVLGGKGKPILGKAVEVGGEAAVAGGSTLAMGGSFKEARTNAIQSVVTSTLMSKAQQGSHPVTAKSPAGGKPAIPVENDSLNKPAASVETDPQTKPSVTPGKGAPGGGEVENTTSSSGSTAPAAKKAPVSTTSPETEAAPKLTPKTKATKKAKPAASKEPTSDTPKGVVDDKPAAKDPAAVKALRSKAKELRKAAVVDPAAVDKLRELYEGQSDSMLRKVKRDPLAAAELDRRESKNPKLEKARASKRRPHDAQLVIQDASGESSKPKKITSGGVTPEEVELYGKNEANNRSHTEAKAVRENALKPGQTMRIDGQYDPCGPCRARMQATATASGASIIYWWPGGPPGGMKFSPGGVP